MKRLIIILLSLLVFVITKAQDCENELLEFQKAFYRKNPEKTVFLNKEVTLESLKSISKLPGAKNNIAYSDPKISAYFDSLVSSANGVIQQDNILMRSLIDNYLIVLSKSKILRKNLALSKLQVGSLPNGQINAEVRPGEECSIITFDINLFVLIFETIKLSYSINPIVRDSLGNRFVLEDYKEAQQTVLKNHDLSLRLDSLLSGFLFNQSLPNHFIPDEVYAIDQIAFLTGSEIYLIAHEIAHIILGHNKKDIKPSQVWEAELNADLLGYKIFEEAIKATDYPDEYRDRILLAPVYYYSIASILFNHSQKKDLGNKFFKKFSAKKYSVYQSEFSSYITLDSKGFYRVDEQINSSKLSKLYYYPPPLEREALLLARILIENLNNPYYELVVSNARNIELLWYGIYNRTRDGKKNTNNKG